MKLVTTKQTVHFGGLHYSMGILSTIPPPSCSTHECIIPIILWQAKCSSKTFMLNLMVSVSVAVLVPLYVPMYMQHYCLLNAMGHGQHCILYHRKGISPFQGIRLHTHVIIVYSLERESLGESGIDVFPTKITH